MANLHAWNERFDRVHEDLLQIFGRRLRLVVAYQTHFGLGTGASGDAAGGGDDHAHALVLVESLAYADLVACAGRVADWLKAGVGTPLFLTQEEFERSLDAFPLEFSAIAAHHVLVAGADPFEEVRIEPGDVRRACETQAKSQSAAPARRVSGGPRRAGSRRAADCRLAAAVSHAAVEPGPPRRCSYAQPGGAGPARLGEGRRAGGAHRTAARNPAAGGRRSVRHAADLCRLPRRRRAARPLRRWVAPMRRARHGTRLLCVSAALLVLLAPAAAADAQDVPDLTQPVNDFAHVIDDAHAQSMDRMIRALQSATGDIVVVATLPTYEPFGSLEQYANKLFENRGRGIGEKGKDNGASDHGCRQGTSRVDRGRLRPGAVHHGRVRRRNDAPLHDP